MNILIIGSKGFIGSFAFSYFANQGHFVCGCDVVNDDSDNYYLINPRNPDYKDIMKIKPWDVCIHCGGSGNVPLSMGHPELDYDMNYKSTELILESIKKHVPSCKFIHLSSAAVYGNPAVLPVNENAPLVPLSPYGKHKMQAEELCSMYTNNFGIKTMSVRIFSAYGEGLRKQLFWDLWQKCKTTSEMVLYGTGNESRDFIHVLDLVQALECVIKNHTFDGSCVNVANGEEILISSAVQTFLEEVNFKGTHRFSGEERKGDPVNWMADITLLSSLGYKRHVSFEEGIKRYVQWLRKQE